MQLMVKAGVLALWTLTVVMMAQLQKKVQVWGLIQRLVPEPWEMMMKEVEQMKVEMLLLRLRL